MAQAPKPIRRVVTGNDAQGRSRVLFDSAAPNINPGAIVRGTCMTDIWVYQHSPAPISNDRDDGNLPFHFEPPAAGGHLRIVQSPGKPRGHDPARDPAAVPPHPPRRRADGVWDRGGQNAFSSPIHKSETGRHCVIGRARARARQRRDRHEAGRCGGAARQLARLDQPLCPKPDGIRDDGGKV